MKGLSEVWRKPPVLGIALGFIIGGVAAGAGDVGVGAGGMTVLDDGGGGGSAVRAGVGACCLDSGACFEITESDCDAALGMYVGDDTACLGDSNGDDIDDACGGACCTCPGTPGEPGVCEEAALHVDCLDGGGFWLGGLSCAPNPCPGVPYNDDCSMAEGVDLRFPDVCVHPEDGSSSGTHCVDSGDCPLEELCAGRYFYYDNRCATDDFPDLGTGCGGTGDLHYDVWYRYTCSFGPYRCWLWVSSCGLVEHDQMMAAYIATPDDCAALSLDDEICCGNDSCGQLGGPAAMPNSEADGCLSLGLLPGATVLVRVGGWDTPEHSGDARGEGEILFAAVSG